MNRTVLIWSAISLVFLAEATALAAIDASNWWSFQHVTKPTLPEDETARALNPIDSFIRARLTKERLSPAPEADRRTLIRRITFDLTGLPPMPEEAGAFLRDQSADAYEKIVDRLLASPRYGERWARHWLDTVHYGETHGYDKDKPRLNAWRYRDYVIEAFNSDKPYSRFIQEQLAADALFPDEPQWTPALGFIAAGPWDFVGHVELPITKTDGLIARYNDRDDMVMNTMSTFQSLTVHCARCHDHKFDPISARDYYALQTVFAGVDRADRRFDKDAQIARERRELTERIRVLAAERTAIEAEIASAGGEPLQAIDRRINAAQSGAKENKAAAFGYHSSIALHQNETKWVQVDIGRVVELDRIEFAGCHDTFNNIGAGFGFPLRYKIEVSNDAAFRNGVTIVEDQGDRDAPNPGTALQSVEVCTCLTDDASRVKARFVRFTATKLAPRQNDFIFALAELRVLDPSGKNVAAGATVTALDSIEAPVRWQKRNLVDDHYVRAETSSGGESLAILQIEREKLTPDALRSRLQSNSLQKEEVAPRLKALPAEELVYSASRDFPANGGFIAAKQPRAVHLLKRGDVKKPGEEMKSGTLTGIPALAHAFQCSDEADESSRRAALAKWLTHPDNLLTRRSIVNRVWHYHFERGLVETPNDFGRMGAEPSHPELLDWLAFWFQENGESLKKLHRLIVTSATYRQVSSEPKPGGVPADSGNRLLWRMNRARLDAEQFRDSILAVSGQLDLTMGGLSVQQFAFKDDHSPVYDYARFDLNSPGANRRSIYRFVVRSMPDPFMDALDCPDASILSPVRNTTMTALQALAVLNDALVIRQAEKFAQRLEKEANSVDKQISRAYELALLRSPSAAERERLVNHAKKHGLANACRVLFNSNEFHFLD
ncbi:MAG TPA: DUF1553 domain-containing protein [Candidatus Acidoferrum sp.]|nr:DUF1553 domain-containing protein [Candidatus Acidoferrum sp.]